MEDFTLTQPTGYELGVRVMCTSTAQSAPVGLTGTIAEGPQNTTGWMRALMMGGMVFVQWDKGINSMVDELFPDGTWEPITELETIDA